MMNDDATLLRQYARDGSQEAFSELVRRHLDLVYAAAWRRTGGDPHRAADVVQTVFASLARHAATLANHALLAGWLHTATRNAALNLQRAEARRRAREQEAFAMQQLTDTPDMPADWDRLRPVLDAAVDELDARDREAVVVRFLQGRTFAEVGTLLRVSEDAARKRVERALDKLRVELGRRGITSTATALGLVLANQSMMAAPAGLAASVAATSAAGGGAAGWFWIFMNTGKLKGMAAGALLVVGIGVGIGLQQRVEARLAELSGVTTDQARALADLRRETAALEDANRRLVAEPLPEAKVAALPGAAADATLARLRLLADLKRRKVTTVDPAFIDVRTGSLDPNFIELFGLSSGEAEQLLGVWRDARRQLSELAAAQATIRQSVSGEVTIEANGFEGGGPVYDRVMDALGRTLGAERQAAFRTLLEVALFRSLYHFGAELRTLTVTRAPDRADGTHVYTSRETWRSLNGAVRTVPGREPASGFEGGGNSVRSQPRTRAEIETEYGAVARRLPNGF